jgi:hypothetical protein
MRLGFAGLIGLLALLWTGAATAEPYLAIREGQKCSACHVNMTGGGMRTAFVAAHAKEILHYPNWFEALTKPADKFTGDLNQYVAIGADLRVDMTAIMQDKPNAQGTVPNNQVFRGRLEQFDINVNQATGYLNVNLIPDLLNFYLDQRFAPSLDTREVWAMALLPYDVYLKAGKMFLPYGMQIQNDNAFIRGGRNGSATTGFSFNVSQPAFELGWEPGPVASAFAVSQGASADTDVQFSGTVSAMFTDLPVVRSVWVGSSGSVANSSDTQTSWFGFFAGSNLERLTYQAEVDIGHLSFPDSTTDTTVASGTFIFYTEANYLFFDWLNTKVAFNYADYDGSLPRQGSDGENYFAIGVEPFLARFLQVRLFYTVGNGVETEPSHNQDLWSMELHVFF